MCFSFFHSVFLCCYSYFAAFQLHFTIDIFPNMLRSSFASFVLPFVVTDRICFSFLSSFFSLFLSLSIDLCVDLQFGKYFSLVWFSSIRGKTILQCITCARLYVQTLFSLWKGTNRITEKSETKESERSRVNRIIARMIFDVRRALIFSFLFFYSFFSSTLLSVFAYELFSVSVLFFCARSLYFYRHRRCRRHYYYKRTGGAIVSLTRRNYESTLFTLLSAPTVKTKRRTERRLLLSTCYSKVFQTIVLLWATTTMAMTLLNLASVRSGIDPWQGWNMSSKKQ